MRTEGDLARAVMRASHLARSLGMDEIEIGQIATSTSELARNILKYARLGTITLQLLDGGIEIVAEDRGPGIRCIEDAMKDHYSEGGTLGLGLPGVRRMMDRFEIESSPRRTWIRVWKGPHGRYRSR
jgi:serine/threonine-protein kinase RsbT